MRDYKINAFVSMCGPLDGVDGIPKCPENVWYCKLVKSIDGIVYTKFLQDYFSFAGYFRDRNHYSQYLANSVLLAPLNLETKVSKYKPFNKNINKIILYKCELDEIVKPNDSEWFSERNKTFTESFIYKKDPIGIKWYYDNDKIIFCKENVHHVDVSLDFLKTVLIPCSRNNNNDCGNTKYCNKWSKYLLYIWDL